MIPWEFLDSAPAGADGEVLSLYRHGHEFSIRVKNRSLMNSTVHGSEDALAELACARLGKRPSPRVLIGGLGMGYTAAAALRELGAASQVIVAELVPAVIKWNHDVLGSLAGHPLQDPRVTVRVIDVAAVLREARSAYDAILLDVDNGPEALTRQGNNWLYADVGLKAALAALRPKGILAIWSAAPSRFFVKRLRQAGFLVEEVQVRARGNRGGRRHVVWLAERT